MDVPGVERVAGQLAQLFAEAHLVEHLEAERHQSFAAEHALEVGLPLEQQHLGAAAREQQREAAPAGPAPTTTILTLPFLACSRP